MGMITNDWQEALKDEFRKPYYRKLYDFVREEYNTTTVYPPADDIFNALHFTPLSEVKVVILGQDPYHNVHQAHGLCFSVLPDQPEIPPSLQNIYKELQSDLGCEIPNNGYLEKWARQGALMLNTVLTVRAHQANSHQNKGWEQFTDAVIKVLNEIDRPIVYFLWGAPAQKKSINA
jgi:uracil-DNA glycosylase